jgi:hypothetical protein
MELDWTTEQAGDVTLVRVHLRNERPTDRRVRLRNRLDGPVLPPRRQREPEAGWDRDGVTAVVPAGSATALGYACPAPPAEPPVTAADVGDPDGSETGTPSEQPVDEALRRLGDARPPRAVVGGEDGASDRETSKSCRSGDEPPVSCCPSRADHPPGVVDVLAPFEERVETVEALGLASVPEAAALLEANGGVAGIERMGEQLLDDAAALRALAVEATALAARAEAATPPTEALRRLS